MVSPIETDPSSRNAAQRRLSGRLIRKNMPTPVESMGLSGSRRRRARDARWEADLKRAIEPGGGWPSDADELPRRTFLRPPMRTSALSTRIIREPDPTEFAGRTPACDSQRPKKTFSESQRQPARPDVPAKVCPARSEVLASATRRTAPPILYETIRLDARCGRTMFLFFTCPPMPPKAPGARRQSRPQSTAKLMTESDPTRYSVELRVCSCHGRRAILPRAAQFAMKAAARPRDEIRPRSEDSP